MAKCLIKMNSLNKTYRYNKLKKSVMKKLTQFLPIMLILISTTIANAQDVRMQSVFLYNFTRLIAWPTDYQSGDFVIAVYGNSPMIAEIDQMASSKKAGNQTIVSKTFNSVDEISKCHILYVPAGQSRRISEIVSALEAKKINALVVTDSRNAISNGAVINFTIIDNRQRFELSQENARKMGLNPGGEISRLAILAD
jgi:hypothetical protein